MIGQDRGQARPLARHEAQILPQRVRDDQDVGKQDRPVEAETPDRLQRHLGGGRAVIDQIEEAALFRPQCPIFGKIAAGLAHQPDGGRITAFPAQHGEQWFIDSRSHAGLPKSLYI